MNVIIRFETTTGRGIYQSGLLYDIGMTTVSSDRHPMPWEEKEFQNKKNWQGSYLFGFDSVEKLLNWFSLDEISKLVALVRFQIKLIRSNDIISSKSQAAFHEDSVEKCVILDKNEFISILKGNPTWEAQNKLNAMV